jgi:hypothetical protein
MGTPISELGVCVPRYDDLTGFMVCAFTWDTPGFLLGMPINRHHICGLDEGHEGDHKTSKGDTKEQE